jgi:hypothetical protein
LINERTGSDPIELFETAVKNVTPLVEQLVRAPPCHGGSCGFESRQSRFFKTFCKVQRPKTKTRIKK